MALHFNSALDDTLLYDRQTSCTGGMVSWVRPNLLSDQQAAVLQDMDAETNLVVSNRRGFHALGNLGVATGLGLQGLWWFDASHSGAPIQLILACCDGELWRMDSTHTWAKVDPSAVPNPTGPVYGAQVADRFYISGPTGPMKFWPAENLKTGGQIGFPVVDGPKDTITGQGSALLYLIAARFRLFGVNPAVQDEVYCSVFLPGENDKPFTLAGEKILPFRVGEGEGDPVVGLVPWKGLFSVVGIKRGSLWNIDTSPAGNTKVAATITADFALTQLSGRVGSVAPRSFAKTGNDVLFLALDGVRSLARTQADGDGAISEPLSQPIMDWVRRINPQALDTATAIFWAGRYLLSVALDESLVPNHVFVWNIRTGGWMIWTQIQAMAWAVASWNRQPQRLLCLDARGQLLEWRDWVQPASATGSDYRDYPMAGQELRVPWRIRTRSLTWQDFESPKDLDGAEFEFDHSNARIDVDTILDGAPARRLLRNERTGFGGLILPFVLPAVLGEKGVRRIPVSLTHENSAREVAFDIKESLSMTPSQAGESVVLRMRGLVAGAYLETIPHQPQ